MRWLDVLGNAIKSPFMGAARIGRFLLNMTGRQVRAFFSLAMMCGIVNLALQNFFYTIMAEHAVERGEMYRPYFLLLQEQMRFNSALIAWFAVIIGLIVFGADYFRAKVADREISFGRADTPTPTPRADGL